MRAFASDLDRTLIFSKRMIELYGSNVSYELIETLKGKEISYISLQTKKSLKQLSKQMLFIPVTTRTVEQFKRISLFQTDIIPEYAITNNGGTILRAGSILKEWSTYIDDQLKDCISLDKMVEAIENIQKPMWMERIKQADNLFIYVIIKRNQITQNDITYLYEWAASLNWQMSIQGRKIYFIPNPINKWNAVKYLYKKLNIEKIYTAGDSLLDFELIEKSDFGISPIHGEVLEHFPNLNKTKSRGMKASDDILAAVLKQDLVAKK